MFAVANGVRQGSTLSPTIFNVSINAFIVNIRLSDVGCRVHHKFVRCFLYADNIILISPSATGFLTNDGCMFDYC